MKPSAGDSTIAAVVAMTPCHTTAAIPPLAIPAPSRPPMSAWELLDGIPRYHVSRFHTMAPSRAASTMVWSA